MLRPRTRRPRDAMEARADHLSRIRPSPYVLVDTHRVDHRAPNAGCEVTTAWSSRSPKRRLGGVQPAPRRHPRSRHGHRGGPGGHFKGRPLRSVREGSPMEIWLWIIGVVAVVAVAGGPSGPPARVNRKGQHEQRTAPTGHQDRPPVAVNCGPSNHSGWPTARPSCTACSSEPTANSSAASSTPPAKGRRTPLANAQQAALRRMFGVVLVAVGSPLQRGRYASLRWSIRTTMTSRPSSLILYKTR